MRLETPIAVLTLVGLSLAINGYIGLSASTNALDPNQPNVKTAGDSKSKKQRSISQIQQRLKAQNQTREPAVATLRELGRFLQSELIDQKTGHTIESVEASAKQLGLRTTKTLDQNEHTGSILFLTGTGSSDEVALLTSQFEGSLDNLALTHLSVIIKPDVDTSVVKSIVEEKIGRSADEIHKAGAINIWELNNGYVFWTQKLDRDQIQNDPHLTQAGVLPGSMRVGRDFEIH